MGSRRQKTRIRRSIRRQALIDSRSFIICLCSSLREGIAAVDSRVYELWMYCYDAWVHDLFLRELFYQGPKYLWWMDTDNGCSDMESPMLMMGANMPRFMFKRLKVCQTLTSVVAMLVVPSDMARV